MDNMLIRGAEWGEWDRVFLSFSSLFAVLQSVSISIHFLFRSQLLIEANKTLLTIEYVFLKNLKWRRIPYEIFEREVVVKALIGLGVWLPTLLPYILYAADGPLSPLTCLGKLSQIGLCLMIWVMVFYVEIVHFFLSLLNMTLERDLKEFDAFNQRRALIDRSKARMIKNKLFAFKQIHFHLWTAVQRINDYFAWTLIPLLLQLFIFEFYSIYWLADMLRLGQNNEWRELTRELNKRDNSVYQSPSGRIDF